MNNTTIHSSHNHVPSVHGFTYGIAFTIGMLILVVVILLACVKLRLPLNLVQLGWRGQPNTTASVQPFVVEVTEQRGIDDDTLQSYPKVLYSEVVQEGGGLVSCSVCLDDYKEDDVLRMLPDCGHLFHLSCIDSWLKSHPTCPICRSSPAPGSQSTGVVTVEEEHVAIPVE